VAQDSRGLKVGDFVKHKKNPAIIFQIVQILEPASGNGPGMLNCVRVRGIHSYPDVEVEKYELTDDDREKIMDDQCL
jgi:hypothetical protein